MMPLIWFWILGVMLTTYVVLDGFDFGTGTLHLLVAKTDVERRTVLAAIGPLWDGNEVWLVASGGLLFFAFPHAYASATSGFYMPLMIVLWLLVFRGLSIELRGQVNDAMWASFWDATFAVASTLLAFVFGATFGNVVRGVPLDADGFFSAPLFTHLMPSSDAGALDAYTCTVGLFAVVALGLHAALFLRWKTEGAMAARATVLAKRLLIAGAVLDVVVAVTSVAVNPEAAHAFVTRPAAWVFALGAVLGAALVVQSLHGRASELRGFLGSSCFLAGTLLAAAAALSPTLLRSTIAPEHSLDAAQTASGAHGLAVAMTWFLPAIALSASYVVMIFRTSRGKATPTEH